MANRACARVSQFVQWARSTFMGLRVALRRRVVPGVAVPTHRHRDGEVRRQTAVGVADVMTACVGVHQQPRSGLALPAPRRRRHAHQLRINRFRH